MTLTIGELHARVKALGLKGAGAIEPIAFAAFSASAEELGETGDRSAWDELGSVHRRAWRSAVLAALEAFPEPEPTPLPPLPPLPVLNADAGPTGGLKPGDVVSVRGVVESAHEHPMAGVHVLLDEGCVSALVTPRTVTFIERPAPPEPTWAPGDLAEDDAGRRFARFDSPTGGDRVWRALVETPGERLWLSRDEIPGPLHRLTVTREDAP